MAAFVTAPAPALARAAAIRTLDGRPLTAVQLDRRIAELMTQNGVTGLGVALIDNGVIVYSRTFGQRDVEQSLPLEPDTVMYGASLTKAVFSTFVMQLVGEGRVDLDRPLASYLPHPLPDYPAYADLAGDERWRKLTMRIVLDQTTGFANLRGFDGGKLQFHRDPGARFGYSGEGFRLAQFVLEQGLGLDVAAEMDRRIFRPLGMKRTAMTWREAFAANVAQGYDENGKLLSHDHRRNVSAAGSMDTTLEDMSRFVAAAARGDGLEPRIRMQMLRRQVEIDSPQQFPTLMEERTDAWRGIGLGYGLGWGVFETPYGHAFFKEGHDDGTANYAVCVMARRDCVLFLSNSVRAERIYVTLADQLLGRLGIPAAWEGFAPGVP